MKRTVLAAVILLGATSALAAPPAGETAPADQAASASPSAATDVAEPPAEEKKICRTQKATGSLTRRNRICMTQAQWREIYDNTRRGVGELQGSASGGNQCVMNSMGACQGSQTPGVTPGGF